jgi:long-chain acyl-CoA synthetase
LVTAIRALVSGLPVVILGGFDAERTLAAIAEHRVEATVMVPTHFVRLLALPAEIRHRYDTTSLRYVLHTGAPCPPAVKHRMIEWWGPVIHEVYGASEVGTTCAIDSGDWLAHPGSVGRAVPPFEAVVVDDAGRPLPANTPGRLYFRDGTGRGVVYHNDPAKSAAAHLAPGVFTLGEVGYVDDDGFVYVTDRFSDMVVSGGANVYPAEAEHVLIQYPGVADVACIGVPDPDLGERLCALVVPADPAGPPDTDALLAFCRERIAHYKCPRRAVVVDSVGRTALGKVNKRALRDQYIRSLTEVAP